MKTVGARIPGKPGAAAARMEELLAEHGYAGLFLAVLVFGFPVLLPAMYLAAKGSLSIAGLFALHVAVALVSDTAWYGAGRLVPLERIRDWRVLRGMRSLFLRLELLEPRALLRFVFVARFLYGAKLTANIVSGALRLRFLPFTLVNLASTALLFWALFALAYTAGEAWHELAGRQARAQTTLWVLVVLGIGLNLFLRKLARMRMARALERAEASDV